MQVICPKCGYTLNHNDRVTKLRDEFICPECNTKFKVEEERECENSKV